MTRKFVIGILFLSFSTIFSTVSAQKTSRNVAAKEKRHLYIDVHQLAPGKVDFASVAAAHAKDLETQGKYGVKFIKFWVDESKGSIYCLSSANDSAAIRKTHSEAHGLTPAQIFPVTDGKEGAETDIKEYFLDFHEFGPGNVSAKDVAGAHEKDLAVQKKHGVNFINYWVDEKAGVVVCLSQADNADAVVDTHKEAHGLLPVRVESVKQGK